MSKIDPFHGDLIRRIGGKTWLAGALGLDRGIVTRWHERGIPSKYWHRVVAIGASLNPPVIVTADDLERTKPETPRASVEASGPAMQDATA